jgi:hypothetical protein
MPSYNSDLPMQVVHELLNGHVKVAAVRLHVKHDVFGAVISASFVRDIQFALGSNPTGAGLLCFLRSVVILAGGSVTPRTHQ